MKLYVVFSSYGEWSECTEWAVAAYGDEALAKTHVEEGDRVVRQHEQEARERLGPKRYEWEYRDDRPVGPWDLAGRDPGDSFYLEDVELRDSLPAAPVVRREAG